MPPKRPDFRFRNEETKELLWAASARAKEVAEMIKKQKNEGFFGPQLPKEQVCQNIIKLSNLNFKLKLILPICYQFVFLF